MGGPPRALLERDGELGAIDAALDGAGDGRGAVVLVEGPAGIGKTRLLSAAREAAAARGLAVLAARGSDLEREFGWGVARQLVEPALAAQDDAAREALLAGPARLASTVLLAGEGDADEGGILHGLYWVCAGLAERGALLVCVDDAHWCDLPSLRFLAYLAHRIEGLPVVLLVGSRPGEAPRDAELLGQLASEPDATVIRPAPLTGPAAAELLAAGLGRRPDAPFVDACQEATQGNPFLLEELARAAREDGVLPDDGGAAAVAGLGPRSVARAIIRRARALTPGAVELARAVAVLGPDAELRHAAALARLDPAEAGRAADALVAAEILADVRPLDVVHPLTRAAITADMTRGERDALHGAAARLLSAEGGAPERIAAHLLHTEPSGDPWPVGILRAAADDALSRGAPSTAAAYLQRSLAEPPPGDELADVLHRLGHAEAVDGLGGGFEEHLRRAMRAARDPQQRGAAALDLARAHGTAGDFVRAGQVCVEALEALAGDDSPVTVALEAELIGIAANEWSLAEAATPLRRRQLARLRAGEIDDVERLTVLGSTLVAGAPPAADGAELLLRAAAKDLRPANSTIPGMIGQALLLAGLLEESREHFLVLEENGRRRGLTAWLWLCESFRAAAQLELGEVRRAADEAQHALEMLEQRTREPGRNHHQFHCAHVAYPLVERGDLGAAQTVIDHRPPGPGPASSYSEALMLDAQSRVCLARGEPDRALACALRAGAEPLRRANPALVPWRSDAARALAALGRQAEAAELAAEELALARAFEVPHAISRALRATALADGDLERATAVLEEAVGVVEGGPARLALMHAHVDLGAVLRRRGKRTAALEHLRTGLDLAHRAGATALAERAHGELLTAGVRPRRAVLTGSDALTASERRVADLAAAGRTNQEIAQALFVTTRTVEAHLTRAFRKLGIASRTELAAALGD